MKTCRLFTTACGSLCLTILAVWGTLAVYYSNLPPLVRPAAAGLFALAAALLIIRGWRRKGPWRSFLLLFAGLFLWWWFAIPPSNDRAWQPDVRLLPWAEIKGDLVTVHNIRNCAYRSESDYTVRHYDRTFDLRRMTSLDFYLVYWGSPRIAHTMLSFGFANGSYLCFSVEARKEVGEGYSALKGFFKQYELTYVLADERDLIKLRTDFREGGKGEDVYLYRLNASMDLARRIFLDYLREVNRLKDHPEWYRALTSNCTTNIRRHTAPFIPHARFDWRIIVNGYLDEMLYERGYLDRSLPFSELKQRSYINPRARAAGDSPDFSRLIRAGLPGMSPSH